MERIQNYSAYGVSTAVHAVILVIMAMFKMSMMDDEPDIAVETVFTEDRVQEQFARELETETDIATTMNLISGSQASTQVAAVAGSAVKKERIETSDSLKQPDIHVTPAAISVPGNDLLGEDLGEGEVAGEPAAVVDGYGAALGQLTREIVRMMRVQKVLLVWLFDESDSMTDDRKEIAQKFHKVTEELKMVQERDKEFKKGQEILLTAVVGYGEVIHPITPEPTADISAVQTAIKKVPIDESGKENMCLAIRQTINHYRTRAVKQRRKLVVVVVTDESGDDGMTPGLFESTLEAAKGYKVPIYVLGRESVFGYPFARIRWYDPKFNLPHWLQISRGPETARPECLQWDGLHGRWDAFSAGFGPYEQVRLCKETGGIFFVLPGEEENLSGAGAHEKRQFDFLDMKEYQPLLLARRHYADAVKDSEFRKRIWDVIVTFNPNKTKRLPGHDPNLNIRELHYSIEINEFKAQAIKEVQKAARAMSLLTQALPMLERIKPLRAKEASQRWRANYDLAFAQLLSYRIRLFQYLLAMDQHANTNPKPQNKNKNKKKSNEWNVRRTPKMIVPNDAQFERVKKQFGVKASKEEYLKLLKQQEQKARELYQFVMTEHPRTPWARRAQWELAHGFGMCFRDNFWDPNYAKLDRSKFPKQ